MCLTKKQERFIAAVERNTVGLTAVSTGVCPGCDQCRLEYGTKIKCRWCNGTGWRKVRPWGEAVCPF